MQNEFNKIIEDAKRMLKAQAEIKQPKKNFLIPTVNEEMVSVPADSRFLVFKNENGYTQLIVYTGVFQESFLLEMSTVEANNYINNQICS